MYASRGRVGYSVFCVRIYVHVSLLQLRFGGLYTGAGPERNKPRKNGQTDKNTTVGSISKGNVSVSDAIYIDICMGTNEDESLAQTFTLSVGNRAT